MHKYLGLTSVQWHVHNRVSTLGAKDTNTGFFQEGSIYVLLSLCEEFRKLLSLRSYNLHTIVLLSLSKHFCLFETCLKILNRYELHIYIVYIEVYSSKL